MTPEQAKQHVTEVFSLYEEHGDEDYIGEPVSQLEHMAQAAQLAEADGQDDEVVLAAFFHDIGHLVEHLQPVEHMDGYGVMDHDLLAGKYLREKGFSDKVARLAESHVAAKRYLTSTNKDYFGKLSEASKMTLQKQGGLMSHDEVLEFESDPLHQLYVQLRIYDDEAKIKEKPLPNLQTYKDMAVKHLLRS